MLSLGNLNAKRDWGYAGEFVDGMWRILQAPEPETFILATGGTETVRNFATLAFRAVDIDLEWVGDGKDERGISAADGRVLVRVDPTYYRPAEVDLLVGCADKAKEVLGWRPATSVENLCVKMVEADVRRHSAVAFPAPNSTRHGDSPRTASSSLMAERLPT